MTRSAFLSVFVLSLSAFQGMAADDPVVMTIGPEKVRRSMFEYYYRKNADTMEVHMSPSEYLPLFEVFRMKVADAMAAGLDTTASFLNEMRGFREELARPCLVDSVYLESFVTEQAERSLTDVEASHIMLFRKQDPEADIHARNRIDSIIGLIRHGEDFSTLASHYSEDKSSAPKGGSLGYISAGRYPYSFESAVYSLPDGCVSEMICTPAGYHVVKAGERRQSAGRIKASHILKFVAPGASPEKEKEARKEIDSIYNLLKADMSAFPDFARRCSDDVGSAPLGGDLSWFGRGDMVPEFEKAAFSLSDGEMSQPVKSAFGWHIILRTGSRPAPGVNELREEVLHRVQDPRDPRHRLVMLHEIERLAAKHSMSIDSVAIARMRDEARRGEISPYTAGDSVLRHLRDLEMDWLYDNVAGYRNLLDEYRDGTLLYEISVSRIWNRDSGKDDGKLEKEWIRDMKERYKVIVYEKEFAKIK